MLWTDADFVSASDLMKLDNEVNTVAGAEEIVLDGPAGVLRHAVEEAGDALLKHLQEFGGTWFGGDVTANHYAALMNVGSGVSTTERVRALLNQIVVSGPTAASWSALKRWATYWGLMVFYRDAANRTNSDRYTEKAESYSRQVHGMYWAAVRAAGLPVVVRPLPCPGALYEPNAGVWGSSNVSAVAGPGTLNASYDVAITYVDSGYNAGNNESHPSARLTVTLTSGNVLRVTLAGLVPPDGQQPLFSRAKAIVPYCAATGWHIYAGPTGGTLWRQTVSPVPITTTTYTLGADPVSGTAQAGLGQVPEKYITFQNWVQRG